MTADPIRDLLTEAARTGVAPSREDVDALVNAGPSAAARADARRAIARTAARVARLTRGGYEAQALSTADDSATGFAAFNRASAAAAAATPPPAAKEREPFDRESTAELQDVLSQAAQGHTVTPADVARLTVRRGVSAAEGDRWRQAVVKTAEQIQRTRQEGNNKLARDVARDALAELGDLAAPTPQAGPDLDAMTPRELAALVNRAG